MGKAHHFHLGELVHADDAARILARAARFRAETGCGRTIGARQLGFVQHFAGVQVGQRHFGGGDEVIVPFPQLKKIFFKLGQLARACHGGAVDHIGRADFYIALILSVLIQKKVDQRPFQAGGPAAQDHKPTARQAGGAFKVKAIQGRAQLAVLTGREIKGRRGAPAGNLHVFRFVLAHGHGGVRQVGYAHKPGFHLGFGLGGCGVQFLDVLGQGG